MLKRGCKLIICVVLVAALFIGYGSAFASAEPAIVTRAKAAVAAIMLAGQLVLNPVDVVLSEPVASAVDPEGRIPWVETLPEYLDRSVIHVYPDVVTIDGVPYSDIWIGPDAVNSLRLQGLDFATAYNILNNQSGITYASGAGYIGNVPIYSVNGLNRSATYNIGFPAVPSSGSTDYSYYDIGDFILRTYTQKGSFNNFSYIASKLGSGSYSSNTSLAGSEYAGTSKGVYIYKYSNTIPAEYRWRFDSVGTGFGTSYTGFIDDPFSFDYTSGVIDAPLAPEDGLLLRVPSSVSDSPVYNYDIHDLINIYPTIDDPSGHTIEIDPEINPDFETDIDIGNTIGDIIRTILNLLDLLDGINIEFAPEPESPEPGPVDPDPAVPDTPVADQDGTWLDELLRWIKQAIDTISQSIIDAQDAIVNEIQDLAQQISEIPSQILEDIETGPSKVFRKALDVLKSLFLPLLLPIKAMMGLWHYVVEWLSSVNAPFLWIFGVMSGTSTNMVLPIYATLAGSICIAIYKALGR